MEVRDLIKKYLREPQVMQLATISGDQPWICTVHFAFDENLNLYWISETGRRHSKELVENKKVAVAIPVRFPEHPVIGIQLEGDAEALQGEELKEGLNVYGDRFNVSDGFKGKLLAGEEVDVALYRVTPRLFVLFDTATFPDNPRQEWKK